MFCILQMELQRIYDSIDILVYNRDIFLRSIGSDQFLFRNFTFVSKNYNGFEIRAVAISLPRNCEQMYLRTLVPCKSTARRTLI